MLIARQVNKSEKKCLRNCSSSSFQRNRPLQIIFLGKQIARGVHRSATGLHPDHHLPLPARRSNPFPPSRFSGERTYHSSQIWNATTVQISFFIRLGAGHFIIPSIS
ncbi:hypothetical protein KSP39_PZI021932 [Platanthera zijinensis]|uniref:Uncharacterized protein n=1 Tax=Platanthera zijinensis TaxID=2320716 RepID=A0AAP0FVU2_9ASPA